MVLVMEDDFPSRGHGRAWTVMHECLPRGRGRSFMAGRTIPPARHPRHTAIAACRRRARADPKAGRAHAEVLMRPRMVVPGRNSTSLARKSLLSATTISASAALNVPNNSSMHPFYHGERRCAQCIHRAAPVRPSSSARRSTPRRYGLSAASRSADTC
jgi:hypothetical protein